MSLQVIQRHRKAEVLPPGHIERRKAQEALKRVYSRCGLLERAWRRRFGKKVPQYSHSPKSALRLCDHICKQLGEPLLKGIMVNSKDVCDGATACYQHKKKVIHFPSRWIGFDVLIHELAHHFGTHGHGDTFCEIEDLLFRVAYTKITGKQPKPDW